MTSPVPQFMVVGADAAQRRIAILLPPPTRADAGPGLVWLPGFKSEMTSVKATALAAWGAEHGRAVTRFDYSGHGQSSGRFEDGRLGAWLEEALAVVRRLTQGPQILVGSSMGGHIALLTLRALQRAGEAERVAGLVLIAPAWDMARLMWSRLSEAARREVMEKGVWMRPSHYGDGPYAITRGLIEEGRNHMIGESPFDPGCPVRIMHGLQDPDVPYEHALDLVAHLSGDWTRMTAIPDGEHRLSRPEDLEVMFQLIEEIKSVG
jgi:pimeloyl-ACP methyl ester carboxylesterase